ARAARRARRRAGVGVRLGVRGQARVQAQPRAAALLPVPGVRGCARASALAPHDDDAHHFTVRAGFLVFLQLGAPLIPNKRLSSFHLFFPFVHVNFTFLAFVKASTTSPGLVTRANVDALGALYPYDGFLYVKRTCKTCGTPKVPRSKHCKMINRC